MPAYLLLIRLTQAIESRVKKCKLVLASTCKCKYKLTKEGAVPPMPSDAFVVKTEAVVKGEGSSSRRPKRQRRK